MAYAEDTKVTVEKSEAELKQLLRRHGAARMATGFDDRTGIAVVTFELGDQAAGTARMVRVQVVVPSLDELEKKIVNPNDPPRGWRSMNRAQKEEWLRKQRDQMERQRWRSLVLVTKAKLELIEQGLSTLEREFLADLVLPGGTTLYEQAAPAIAEAYRTGQMPALLPGEVTPQAAGRRPARG